VSPRADLGARLRRRRGDAGFTILEIMVAIVMLGIVAAAATPLFIVALKAASLSKLNTEAKNLSQQRFEEMRDMQYHVDRQNGPFVDLLDVYYTDLNTTATSRTRGTETLVGKWISTGGTSPDPSGPFYQVSIPQVAGNSAFSQTIDTQFLTANGVALPSTRLTGYDSQVEGKDSPPALMVGVTITTSWSDHGSTKSYTSYTRITDSRGVTTLLTTQAEGELLRVTSTGSAGNPITVDAADATADGSVTTASTATADAKAFVATDGTTTVSGATGIATLPTGGGSVLTPVNNISSGSGNCGWVSASSTSVSNTTATISGGLPKVPANLDTANPPVNQTTASLNANGGNSPTCGLLAISNESSNYDSALGLNTDIPLIRMPNTSGASSVANASAWVTATTSQTSPHSATSGANIAASRWIALFPGLTVNGNSFITDGMGLVDITLTSASLSCSSTVTAGSTAALTSTGSYTATVDYWTTSGRQSQTFSWNSATGSSVDPLAALNPSAITVYQSGGTTLHLSDFIASWSSARAITQTSTSGLHQINGVLNIATQPVRAGDPSSALAVQVGALSCAAEDDR
jgi:prepilin-type N-terminal cleavage/methylation domain-containing protein